MIKIIKIKITNQEEDKNQERDKSQEGDKNQGDREQEGDKSPGVTKAVLQTAL